MTSRFHAPILAVVAALSIACSGDKADEMSDSAEVASEAPADNTMDSGADTGPIALSAADFDGFEKGIARETQLVKEAAARAQSAVNPQERGAAIQAGFDVSTIPAAAPVTGLSADRYRLVRETLSKVMTTLDFQGKIDGPQSVDTSRADPALRARLASDPYEALDSASAAELKSRLSRIVPVWVEYTNLTAVGG